MSFKEKKYEIVREAISYELVNFIYNYFLLKRESVALMYKHNIIYDNGMWGTWKDQQVPNTYSIYADQVMETLMMKVLPIMRRVTDMKLIPTYSYARVYKKGDILKRHKDRPSCEISCTMSLGGDPWEIFLDPTGVDTVLNEQQNLIKPNAPKGISLTMKPGDMLIYSGCELEHWREPFQGEACGQVFLHYNNADRPFANQNLYDRRPILGVPKLGNK